jgi:hypothetical protein
VRFRHGNGRSNVPSFFQPLISTWWSCAQAGSMAAIFLGSDQDRRVGTNREDWRR